MQDRIKEHDRDIRLAPTENSAVSEHNNRTQVTLELSEVYWSWPLLLHAQGQRSNSYKTSPTRDYIVETNEKN